MALNICVSSSDQGMCLMLFGLLCLCFVSFGGTTKLSGGRKSTRQQSKEYDVTQALFSMNDIQILQDNKAALPEFRKAWLQYNSNESSADQEPAWRNVGEKVGLQIWRIVNFKVTAWPVEDYGKFYDGDSYIVLNTYKKEGSEKYLYDVHFWIGNYSTADEYGTAAYKTVELDTFLMNVPVQHREVQDHESILFKTYFTSITIMRGGAESGFRHVKAQEYLPRLFHFHGDKHRVEVKEITRNAALLDGSDVYILDLGLNLYQWNGETSNKDERNSAAQYLHDMKSERGGNCKAKVLDEKQEFLQYMDEVVPKSEHEYVSDDADAAKEFYRHTSRKPLTPSFQ